MGKESEHEDESLSEGESPNDRAADMHSFAGKKKRRVADDEMNDVEE